MWDAADILKDIDRRTAGRLATARWWGTRREWIFRLRNWRELFAVDLIITYHNPYNPL